MALEAITIEPNRKADACVIWLHGLGADGSDFADVVPQLGLPREHAIRFIFPHAPHRPITINAGFVMPGWYDVVAIDTNVPQDEKGIKQSAQALRDLMALTMQEGIASQRILLMGFSQGGALALHTALRYEQPLAGVGVLSAYLPLHDLVEKEKHPSNQTISIFMAHGLNDPIVPYRLGQQSLTWLQSAGYNPDWHTYAMEHTVCMQELADIGKWLNRQLPLQ